MWAYRVPKGLWNMCLTVPINQVTVALKAQIKQGNIEGNEPADSVASVKTALVTVRKLFDAIGWDGTAVGNFHCFGVPDRDTMQLGYLLQEGTGGRVFIATPIELAHLDKVCDWDAKVSTEMLRDTYQQLTGETPTVRPVSALPWRRSAKGNMWTKINNALTTVFPSPHGYCACISGAGDLKTFTQTFQNEGDCMNYVLDNFYELTRSWRNGVNTASEERDTDNPGQWFA